MKRSNISAGNRLVLSNGTTVIVYSVKGTFYVVPEGSHYLGTYLSELCDNDLQPLENCAEIVEIRNSRGNIIWTKPVEMTISEIEKALKLTPGTLRIKK